jgi:hypothetical protein
VNLQLLQVLVYMRMLLEMGCIVLEDMPMVVLYHQVSKNQVELMYTMLDQVLGYDDQLNIVSKILRHYLLDVFLVDMGVLVFDQFDRHNNQL